MMGMISLSTNWRAGWGKSFSSSLSWQSKSMKSTPGKEGMKYSFVRQKRDAGSVARPFRKRQENEGIEGRFSLLQTAEILRGRRTGHVRQGMLRQNGHEIRENSAKRHRGAPLYESKDPGTAPRDNRCAGGNVGACMGGGKRKEFMDCIRKGGDFALGW